MQLEGIPGEGDSEGSKMRPGDPVDVNSERCDQDRREH